jgi:hypothetical protein
LRVQDDDECFAGEAELLGNLLGQCGIIARGASTIPGLAPRDDAERIQRLLRGVLQLRTYDIGFGDLGIARELFSELRDLRVREAMRQIAIPEVKPCTLGLRRFQQLRPLRGALIIALRLLIALLPDQEDVDHLAAEEDRIGVEAHRGFDRLDARSLLPRQENSPQGKLRAGVVGVFAHNTLIKR